MRILTGRFKGHTILTKDLPYRPTQSRVRKSLFDILGPLDGKTFCDGFAGSGIMGMEALSRGAEAVTLIEKNKAIYSLLKRNTERFETSRLQCLFGDYVLRMASLSGFDIVFTDPPYQLAADKTEMTQLIDTSLAALNQAGIYILETASDLAQFPADRHKKYGDTTLLFWRK
ncbi:MAG: RsmD family RNA methyltransferase [Fidelibacterota bacterium]